MKTLWQDLVKAALKNKELHNYAREQLDNFPVVKELLQEYCPATLNLIAKEKAKKSGVKNAKA